VADAPKPDWMPDAPLLLTVVQAAAMLNVSTKTIRLLVARRELAARRWGAKILIPRSSIEAAAKKDHVLDCGGRKAKP